jgi:hypothetical protein
VLIVILLHRESLKLVLVNDPPPRGGSIIELRVFIKPSAHNQVVYMELSLCLSFKPQMQPQGLHGGHHRRIPNWDRGGFSPTISPLNPLEVSVVTYEYLFCPSLSDRLSLLAQRRARGLLSGSSTLGTMAHQIWPKILDTTGSLQGQTAGESYTPYQIKPHHSRLKRWCHKPKKN